MNDATQHDTGEFTPGEIQRLHDQALLPAEARLGLLERGMLHREREIQRLLAIVDALADRLLLIAGERGANDQEARRA